MIQGASTEKSATPMRLAEKSYRGADADFTDVIDFRHRDRCTSSNRGLVVPHPHLALAGAPEAKVYSLRGYSGFYFVDRAVPSAEDQVAWSRRCVSRYCAAPLAVTNISQLASGGGGAAAAAAAGGGGGAATSEGQAGGAGKATAGSPGPSEVALPPPPPQSCTGGRPPSEKLRWATLGHHFDWATRTYPRELSSCAAQLPTELGALATRVAAAVGQSVRAETAIVNFYRHNSAMCAHQDDCEEAVGSPVVSVSFGCSAVFLLGGLSRDQPPVALWVRSGDAMVLGGEVRLAFHAMARVLRGSCPEALRSAAQGDGAEERMVRAYLEEHRININVRQVNTQPS